MLAYSFLTKAGGFFSSGATCSMTSICCTDGVAGLYTDGVVVVGHEQVVTMITHRCGINALVFQPAFGHRYLVLEAVALLAGTTIRSALVGIDDGHRIEVAHDAVNVARRAPVRLRAPTRRICACPQVRRLCSCRIFAR